jgi:thymidylate synthase
MDFLTEENLELYANQLHDENQYLDLIKHIITNGNQKSDRTQTGTLSVFGTQSRYSLRNGK